MSNPWLTGLGVLLLLSVDTLPDLKPAMHPVIENQPFNIFWAAPTIYCRDAFNVNMDLKVFNILSNPSETQSGSTITIFYPNELGYYPYFSRDGEPFNGGIPQNMSLPRHLRKAADDITEKVLWWRSEGLVVIDWESWKPQWERNWGNRIIYKEHSLAFARDRHPNWSETEMARIAQLEFESAGRNLMNTTLTLAREMRPKRLWGFYLYPDCYNYDYRVNSENYTGNCPDGELLRNDQLLWLWERSTALFPSIYLDKMLKSSANALKFVHYRVREAMRVAALTTRDYVLPVFVFSRPFYLRSIETLSQEDLVHTIGESAALGAAGVILWGGDEYTVSKETCLSVKQSVQGPLGHYAVNVTSAAQFCSETLCNSHGRCVRKTPESSSYLHMPESSRRKYVISKSLRFTLSESSKLKATTAMKNGFVCHCYHGWHGESCHQQPTSDLSKRKNTASITPFSLPTFLCMTLPVIPLHFL
ncbi:hyaluronidase-4-like [Ochotona curzoniae]|uniref:hyaluronidase-4-like n=1 Tax=Ochotona curzoniae TaxID=130825 RepID=UPI001B34615E|nr:hyaluronidase-4-like [Ochotona curzoniae]